ncbi:MAG: hypothetical protein ABI867_09315 [Kofleriaceae bacterium]
MLDRERAHELVPVGEKMNATEAGVFAGLRAARDGFACELGDSELWVEHYRAIRSFIAVHRAQIREAIEIHADVTFDVAIDEDDQAAQRHALILRCPPDLLAELASCGASLEFSIYRGAEHGDR